MVQRRGAFSHQGNADRCSLLLGHAACLSRSQRAPHRASLSGKQEISCYALHLLTPYGSQVEEESPHFKRSIFFSFICDLIYKKIIKMTTFRLDRQALQNPDCQGQGLLEQPLASFCTCVTVWVFGPGALLCTTQVIQTTSSSLQLGTGCHSVLTCSVAGHG